MNFFMLCTFNSTRYIRNVEPDFSNARGYYKSFNSTRYIRNCRDTCHALSHSKTFNSTRYIRNRWNSFPSFSQSGTFNSTRYIRNGEELQKILSRIQLSTPHGTLGTHSTIPLTTKPCLQAFNSTRYIRNFEHEG